MNTARELTMHEPSTSKTFISRPVAARSVPLRGDTNGTATTDGDEDDDDDDDGAAGSRLAWFVFALLLLLLAAAVSTVA